MSTILLSGNPGRKILHPLHAKALEKENFEVCRYGSTRCRAADTQWRNQLRLLYNTLCGNLSAFGTTSPLLLRKLDLNGARPCNNRRIRRALRPASGAVYEERQDRQA
ncbi:hypothetical protein ACFQBQ_03705 [Granulicella cerasi]|uniref:Uncharacterized protein n=1 Tax=Granulicella cerasi TaxID=741063 RepID=A0ABW1Z569_9BACT|nr:hypothetical protein [Granulicella cerasi]